MDRRGACRPDTACCRIGLAGGAARHMQGDARHGRGPLPAGHGTARERTRPTYPDMIASGSARDRPSAWLCSKFVPAAAPQPRSAARLVAARARLFWAGAGSASRAIAAARARSRGRPRGTNFEQSPLQARHIPPPARPGPPRGAPEPPRGAPTRVNIGRRGPSTPYSSIYFCWNWPVRAALRNLCVASDVLLNMGRSRTSPLWFMMHAWLIPLAMSIPIYFTFSPPLYHKCGRS